MPTLYHIWLSPASRTVRLVLAETQVEVELKTELYWERREGFLKMNPAGEVPVLVEDDGHILADATAICEYLIEQEGESTLMGPTPRERAEIRRISRWFNDKYNREVSTLLINEKVMKRFLKMGEPDSMALRAALTNLRTHMAYINHITERRNYLAGDQLSLADLTAAAHLSVADYLGDVDWDKWEEAKTWYMRVKSRPCFRTLLKDRIGGLAPPPYYDKLDF